MAAGKDVDPLLKSGSPSEITRVFGSPSENLSFCPNAFKRQYDEQLRCTTGQSGSTTPHYPSELGLEEHTHGAAEPFHYQRCILGFSLPYSSPRSRSPEKHYHQGRWCILRTSARPCPSFPKTSHGSRINQAVKAKDSFDWRRPFW